jgi:hypothetical protein
LERAAHQTLLAIIPYLALLPLRAVDAEALVVLLLMALLAALVAAAQVVMLG